MHAYSSGNTTCVNVLIDKYANTPHTQTTCTHSVIHTTHHLSTHSSNTHKHMYVRTSRQVLAEKTSYIRTNIHTCVCMYANSHFLSSCVGQPLCVRSAWPNSQPVKGEWEHPNTHTEHDFGLVRAWELTREWNSHSHFKNGTWMYMV